MPQCPNCQEAVKTGWAHCPSCGADLKTGKFSSSDDPLERLENKFTQIDEFLTEKFPDEVPNDEPPNTPPSSRKKPASKKRKTIFGD